jgi:DNA-binding response OmpR family regulator
MSSTPLSVLVLETDLAARDAVLATLDASGYDTWEVTTGEEALRMIERHGPPDLAVVGAELTRGMNGVEFCRRLREANEVPIIVLVNVVNGTVPQWLLEECAHDFMVKPIREEELALRVGRALRGIIIDTQGRQTQATFGPRLRIDLVRQEAVVNGRTVPLTDRECALLQLLIRHKNKTLTFDYLLSQVWQGETASEDALRVAIHRLRQKIETQPDQPRYILSVRGRGYTFAAG